MILLTRGESGNSSGVQLREHEREINEWADKNLHEWRNQCVLAVSALHAL
jgi:hypothetical protein